MRDKLKQKLTTAHAALGYAITTGNGIHEASIAWDKATDDYYALLDAECITQAVESYIAQCNEKDNKENTLLEL